MSQIIRSVLVVLIGGAVLLLAADRIVNSPTFQFPKDFLEYWASGRLNLRGENPYDPTLLLAEQRTVEPDRPDAVMMWNPPPSLAVYMPLGFLPARWASLLWVGLQFAAVMLACHFLAKEYAPSRLWLGPVIGLSFVGTWWVVAYGQNTGLLVLGLAGFLHYTQREKPLAAGACAALTALKPHLLAGFGVLMLVDACRHRGRIALGAGVGVIAVALALVLLANPRVVQQYTSALRDPGPHAISLHAWTLPVPAYWLRITLDESRFWIQFLPCAIMCLALALWRFRAGESWDWKRALPFVVGISVLAAPYGGWIFDLTVLLVPVMWCAARLAIGRSWKRFVAFLAAQIAVTMITFATAGALHAYWWVAPAALALCPLAFLPMTASYTTPARSE